MNNQLSRVRDIDSGTIMVVTDIHGDYPAYAAYRDRFLGLRERGEATILVFCGDLIHAEPSEAQDRSLDIIRDVLMLKEELGDDLIYLLGNHEMPHIYSTTLARGEHVYTIAFEHALNDDEERAAVVALFDGLPFYVRTHAGVTLSHAGAAETLTNPDKLMTLLNYSHADVLAKADDLLAGQSRVSLRRAMAKQGGAPYEELAHNFLAVRGPDDARYDDLLRGMLATSFFTEYDVLDAALFTRNESQYGAPAYKKIVDGFLIALSRGRGYEEQRVLVAGHINIPGGHVLVGRQQLRLASRAHAHPRDAGQYLLFDAAQKVDKAEDLLDGLHSVFE